MKAKKKKRQDDFQKVKLKVGKKKPRADNATNTNFRTRGICLPDQLKRDTSGPTTHRQLGINVSSAELQNKPYIYIGFQNYSHILNSVTFSHSTDKPQCNCVGI